LDKASTTPQKKLTGKQRKQQKDNLYLIKDIPNKLFTKKILLVDDIMTTGASLNQGAYILKNLGAYHITAFAFCRD